MFRLNKPNRKQNERRPRTRAGHCRSSDGYGQKYRAPQDQSRKAGASSQALRITQTDYPGKTMKGPLFSDYTWWMSPEQKAAHVARERAVRKAEEKFERRIRKAIEEAAPLLADSGMGNGRNMVDLFDRAMRESGAYQTPARTSNQRRHQTKIRRSLSKAVFERDGYRCVMCNTHLDLCCDHVISEADGGPTTLENLQTLCRPCNTRKGSRSFSVLRGQAA
jgi:5-methylcytosine-specific restriction endonuclease McrA